MMSSTTKTLTGKIWHSHFATSNRKVQNVSLLLRQNELFRSHALAEFAELLDAVDVDPAMLLWLDRAGSRRGTRTGLGQ